MPNTWQYISGGVLEADNRDGTNVLEVAEDKGEMSRLRNWVRSGVADDTP